jgi:hypothetical protein
MGAIDFTVQDEGTLVIVHALTPAAVEWMAENVDEDVMRWGIDGYVIEHRYAQPIVHGMQAEGLRGGV